LYKCGIIHRIKIFTCCRTGWNPYYQRILGPSCWNIPRCAENCWRAQG